jgi:uncharacterized protein YbjT (DUF2867 family)
MKIVVIGGTGRVGSKVVATLAGQGHDAVPASPASGVDTVTGAGLAEVLSGADVVVDVSNSPSFADADVLAFFRSATTNLLAAEAVAGVGHHVALSVVGADRLPDSGYLRAKVVQEELIRDGGVPFTIVRATQFFEFVESIADSAADGDTVRLPSALVQPIAAEDVAVAVSRTAVAAPVNGTVDIAGPDLFGLDELVRLRDSRRTVVTDPAARYFGAVLAERSLVPDAGATIADTHYEAWLRQVVLGVVE